MRRKKVPFLVVLVGVILLISIHGLFPLLLVSFILYKIINRRKKNRFYHCDIVAGSAVTKKAPTEEEEEKETVAVNIQTLSPEHQKLHKLTNGLRAKQKELKHTAVGQEVGELAKQTKRITNFIDKNPKKISELNQFIEYYLPTTIDLLSAYQDIKADGQSGDNANLATEKIEEMLLTLQDAFEKQLDTLFAYKSLDISAEIATMSTLLEKDGLIEVK